MVIYGEYLFIENFITGAIILFFTKKITGMTCSKWAIAIGAALCGAYSFAILVSLAWPVSLGLKLAFTGLVTLMVFRPNGRQELLRGALTFLVVSLLMGGTTFALLSIFQMTGVWGAGVIYMGGLTYGMVTACVLCSGGVVWWFAGLIRAKRLSSLRVLPVVISLGGRQWQVKGLLDTGNFLREPISGKPVALLGETIAQEIFGPFNEETLEYLPNNQLRAKFCLIPYKTVGKDEGLMRGYKVDYIICDGRRIPQPIVGIYDGFFADDYQMLLHLEMLEGGIGTDGQACNESEAIMEAN